jgi:ribosomal protein S12 methylthiotransferase
VSPEEKEDRRGEIMEIQAGISLAHNRSRLGRTIDVLVEGPDPGTPGLWKGRGRFQAPEVDGLVRFALPPGTAEPPSAIVRVELDAAGAYDLSGRLVP